MPRLTADLRLSTANLRADVQRAASVIQSSLGKGFGGGGTQGLATDPSSFISQILGGSATQQKTRLAHEMTLAQGAKQLMAMGPLFPPRPNYGLAALGAGAGMFSPFIGARLMNQSGIFNGGGGGGGIAGQLFGPGGAGGFGAAFIGLQLASRALKGAFDQLVEAVKRTAKLYQESAAINRPVSQIFQAQSAFSAIGLGPDAAKRYAKSGPGGLTPEEMMQFTNMSKEFAVAWKDSATDAKVVSSSAAEAQGSFYASARLSREWHTFWTGGIIAQELTRWKNDLADIFKLINAIAALTGGGKASTPPTVGAFNFGTLKQTSLERMGFSIGGNPAIGYLKDIAKNTHALVMATIAAHKLNGSAGGIVGAHAGNLP